MQVHDKVHDKYMIRNLKPRKKSMPLKSFGKLHSQNQINIHIVRMKQPRGMETPIAIGTKV